MKITNIVNGKSVTFGGKGIFQLSGMSWGSASAQHTTTQGSGQIGTTVQDSIISGRPITITGWILMRGASGMETNRRLISSIVNPLHTLRIEHGEYMIEGRPNSTIEWATGYKDNNKDHAKFTFSLYCEYPYFTHADELITDVALWSPCFQFPLAIPPEGIKFSERQQDLIVNVENPGDVPVGMVAIFTAKGTVVNPQIENIETREYIKIEITMLSGDEITINTNYGRKNEATLDRNGVKTNILDYLDIESNYEMQLNVGTNLIKYSADEGVDALSVRVKRTSAISTMPLWG